MKESAVLVSFLSIYYDNCFFWGSSHCLNALNDPRARALLFLFFFGTIAKTSRNFINEHHMCCILLVLKMGNTNKSN